jgi:ribosomal-protein-alanine N-acetyltransferase
VFVLRNYRQGDFEALYRIDRECFEADIAYSRSELQSYIERKHSICIVAEMETSAQAATDSVTHADDIATNQSIAGFVVVEIYHQGYGHVITIDVLSGYRRRQLGSLLLQAAEEQVRKIGGFMMVLETAVNNDAALAFYERHKYRMVHKLPGYYGKRLDAWFLSKRL